MKKMKIYFEIIISCPVHVDHIFSPIYHFRYVTKAIDWDIIPLRNQEDVLRIMDYYEERKIKPSWRNL